MKMPKPLLAPSIVRPLAVEPSIRRLLLLSPSWPLRPGFSGGRMLFPSAIVLLAGRPKLIVTGWPERLRALAWSMQYRKSPLVPDPTPVPNGLVSVVAVTVNEFWHLAGEATKSGMVASSAEAKRMVRIMAVSSGSRGAACCWERSRGKKGSQTTIKGIRMPSLTARIR